MHSLNLLTIQSLHYLPPPKKNLQSNEGVNEGRGGKERLVLLLTGTGFVTDKLDWVPCSKLVSLVCSALFWLGTCSEEGQKTF